MFADVLAPRAISTETPHPGPPADHAGEPFELAERPTASEPRSADR
jgi:hypothetical protein